ncbi:hypothetical protein EPI10_000587 [Gossypium australe]|uniref:Uncharacterized protein n=1 Tax=Gossypium australe TaxID=47621 RepID=A0A5B6V8K2_9ROSI|nr:hypothetical protein EPI10_000587 [Gossypium australe]
MLGYSFDIVYRKWSKNIVVDALSRQPDYSLKGPLGHYSHMTLHGRLGLLEMDVQRHKKVGERM